MKNKYPHFNPYMMGLMGGAQGFLSGLGNYFDEQRKHGDKLDEINAKYSAMGDANKAKAENQKLMSALKLEAGQRSYNVDTTDENGSPVRVAYRNTYDPATQSYSPHEIGRVPLSSLQKGGAPVTRNFGDQVKQWNPDTKTWDTVGSNANNAVSQREQTRDAKIDARENQRDDRSKMEHLDTIVARDMAAFDNAKPDVQAQMLKAAGVADKVPDQSATKWSPSFAHPFGTAPDPKAQTDNPDLRQQYEDAITAKHAKRLGVAVPKDDSGSPSAAAPAGAPAQGGAQPTFDAQGRQIKYDAQGNAFVKGPDGKPVPAETAPPLAMDEAHAQNQSDAGGDETGAPDDGSDPNSAGLMAGTESQQSDEPQDEPEAPDQGDDEEQQPQGLMA